MSKKTAVGGFDENWLPIAGVLVSLGVLPKSLRPVVGALGTALLAYNIAKRLGWL